MRIEAAIKQLEEELTQPRPAGEHPLVYEERMVALEESIFRLEHIRDYEYDV